MQGINFSLLKRLPWYLQIYPVIKNSVCKQLLLKNRMQLYGKATELFIWHPIFTKVKKLQ
ncbi:hypothetical protein ILUMI_14014 [Ignelater luminosus]|uniref:Uncharacterized protein n=1 Tax=Ignelater luminosus TaxID=2038154 RepID=A0A8K0CTA9_IGNLU|nr:hypothetical protein ILUMI_14014 [Ignelater luminosus]